MAVLRPELLGRLARRKQGRERCEMRFFFREPQLNIHFSFATNSRSEVGIDRAPEIWLEKSPVFLPTRELLTIYPNFVSVYENHYLEFEETWRDTCILLGAPALRGPTETRIKSLLRPLEKAMDGKIVLEKSGRFYLNVPGEGKMEITLVAEGLTKLGMLARLIATGVLLDTGYLFWDEPDTSLNPKLVKQVANSVVKLCQGGIQIFLATHSLFLMRELDILLRGRSFKNIRPRFFGLQRGEEGVTVEQGDSANDIGPIAALEEELKPVGSLSGDGVKAMPTVIKGNLSFQFPTDWRAEKFDESGFYRNQFQRVCGGAKAVDILALGPDRSAWFIEIKIIKGTSPAEVHRSRLQRLQPKSVTAWLRCFPQRSTQTMRRRKNLPRVR